MKLSLPLLGLMLILAFTACPLNLFAGMYSATAQMRVQLRGNAGASNEIEIMQSPAVLVPIITDLKLDAVWAQRSGRSSVLPMMNALDHMNSMLKFEAVPGTNLIKITASSEVPQEAADIANAIVDRYKNYAGLAQDQLNLAGIDTTKQQIAQTQKLLEQAQAAVKQNPQDEQAQKECDFLPHSSVRSRLNSARTSPPRKRR